MQTPSPTHHFVSEQYLSRARQKGSKHIPVTLFQRKYCKVESDGLQGGYTRNIVLSTYTHITYKYVSTNVRKGLNPNEFSMTYNVSNKISRIFFRSFKQALTFLLE